MKDENSQYFPALSALILPGVELPFTCFVYLQNNDRIVPAFHAHDQVSAEKLRKLNLTESDHFFVRREDVKTYFRYLNEQISKTENETLREQIRQLISHGQLHPFMPDAETVAIDLTQIFTSKSRIELEIQIAEMGANQSLLLQKVLQLIKSIRPSFGSLIAKWLEFFAIAKRKFNPDDALRAGEIAKTLQEFEAHLFSELNHNLTELQGQFDEIVASIKKINPNFHPAKIEDKSLPIMSWQIEDEKPLLKPIASALIDEEADEFEKLKLENSMLKNQMETLQEVVNTYEKNGSAAASSEDEFAKVLESQSAEIQEHSSLAEYFKKRCHGLEKELSSLREKVIEMNREKINQEPDVFLEIERDLLFSEKEMLRAQIQSLTKNQDTHKELSRLWEARKRAMERLLSIYKNQIERLKSEVGDLQQFKASILGQTKDMLFDKRNILQQSVILGSQLQVEVKKNQVLLQQIEAFKKREFEIRQTALQNSVEQERLKSEIQSLNHRLSELSSDDRSEKLKHREELLKVMEQKLEFIKLESKEYKIRFAQEQNKVQSLEKELRAMKAKLKRAS